MLATVRTAGPFRGIIYASERQSECRALGKGAKETLIDIPLTDFDRCNVHYDPATEEYSVTLNVHEHPIIILQQDRVFNLSCSRSGPESNNNSNPFNTINEPRQLQMGVYRQDAKIHHVLFGNPYTMRIESNGREDFTVTSCFGFAGQNDSLRLTDSNGCSTDMALISNFLYDPNAHAAQANLYSMFKFPEHDMIHLQCSVEICSGACPRVSVLLTSKFSPKPANYEQER
uniref:ZP domain-containing protein n=1 Tax=Plectus sambesii TaxID=2011161 RepID=A0A914WYR1_9BILA